MHAVATVLKQGCGWLCRCVEILWKVYCGVLSRRPKEEAQVRYNMLCQILTNFIQSLAPVLEQSNLQNWAQILLHAMGGQAPPQLQQHAGLPCSDAGGTSLARLPGGDAAGGAGACSAQHLHGDVSEGDEEDEEDVRSTVPLGTGDVEELQTIHAALVTVAAKAASAEYAVAAAQRAQELQGYINTLDRAIRWAGSGDRRAVSWWFCCFGGVGVTAVLAGA